MRVTVNVPTPRRALAIGAHPDDIEFGCGATLAKWAHAGAEIALCVCTDGSKGTWDGDADLGALVVRRADEQRDAAKVLGAGDVVMLGYVDGELVEDIAARSAVAAVLRRVRPDVVLAHDPWRVHRLHPDHSHAGRLAIAGIVAARDPHFFPEHDLPPHRPSTLLLFESERVNHVERVDGFIERKIDALLAHRSQWQSTLGIHADPEREREQFARALHDEARAEGLRAGVRAAEPFALVGDL